MLSPSKTLNSSSFKNKFNELLENGTIVDLFSHIDQFCIIDVLLDLNLYQEFFKFLLRKVIVFSSVKSIKIDQIIEFNLLQVVLESGNNKFIEIINRIVTLIEILSHQKEIVVSLSKIHNNNNNNVNLLAVTLPPNKSRGLTLHNLKYSLTPIFDDYFVLAKTVRGNMKALAKQYADELRLIEKDMTTLSTSQMHNISKLHTMSTLLSLRKHTYNVLYFESIQQEYNYREYLNRFTDYIKLIKSIIIKKRNSVHWSGNVRLCQYNGYILKIWKNMTCILTSKKLILRPADAGTSTDFDRSININSSSNSSMLTDSYPTTNATQLSSSTTGDDCIDDEFVKQSQSYNINDIQSIDISSFTSSFMFKKSQHPIEVKLNVFNSSRNGSNKGSELNSADLANISTLKFYVIDDNKPFQDFAARRTCSFALSKYNPVSYRRYVYNSKLSCDDIICSWQKFRKHNVQSARCEQCHRIFDSLTNNSNLKYVQQFLNSYPMQSKDDLSIMGQHSSVQTFLGSMYDIFDKSSITNNLSKSLKHLYLNHCNDQSFLSSVSCLFCQAHMMNRQSSTTSDSNMDRGSGLGASIGADDLFDNKNILSFGSTAEQKSIRSTFGAAVTFLTPTKSVDNARSISVSDLRPNSLLNKSPMSPKMSMASMNNQSMQSPYAPSTSSSVSSLQALSAVSKSSSSRSSKKNPHSSKSSTSYQSLSSLSMKSGGVNGNENSTKSFVNTSRSDKSSKSLFPKDDIHLKSSAGNKQSNFIRTPLTSNNDLRQLQKKLQSYSIEHLQQLLDVLRDERANIEIMLVGSVEVREQYLANIRYLTLLKAQKIRVLDATSDSPPMEWSVPPHFVVREYNDVFYLFEEAMKNVINYYILQLRYQDLSEIVSKMEYSDRQHSRVASSFSFPTPIKANEEVGLVDVEL